MTQAITLPNKISYSINRESLLFGFLYGLAIGAALAAAMWIRDAFMLNAAHAFYPWLKLFLGLVLFGLIGGVAGFLATLVDRIWFSLLAWIGASMVFAWLTVQIPLQMFPVVAKWLSPELRTWMTSATISGNDARFAIALMWIVFFLGVAGVLQSTLVDSAVFASAAFGRIAPFLICIVLATLGGVMLDDLINSPLRSAIVSVETPIQFLIDNHGLPIDKETSRKFRVTAFRNLQEKITREHQLIVIDFDEVLGQIEVLVKFDGAWVTCTTIYGQTSYCRLADLPTTQPVRFLYNEDLCLQNSVSIWHKCSPLPTTTPKDMLAMPSPATPSAQSA